MKYSSGKEAEKLLVRLFSREMQLLSMPRDRVRTLVDVREPHSTQIGYQEPMICR